MNSHLCLFYSQRNDRYLWTRCRTLIAQTDSTTRWLYIADEHSTKTVQEQLDGKRHGEVIDSAELAFRRAPIRIHLLLADLTRRVEAALNACAKVLLFVEMSWAIRTPSAAVYLREYEAAIEELSEQWPLTVVCLYNQQVMLDRQLLIGLHTHPVLVVSDTTAQNPYYVPPAIFASRNQRQQFEYWLHQIDPHSASEKSAPAKTIHSTHKIREERTLIAEDSSQGRWKVRCFGGPRVYRADGTLIDWNVVSGATRKSKTLFAFLLFRGEVGATAEEIADLLWPEVEKQKQSMNRLYHTVRCLRRALSPELKSGRKSPFVLKQDHRYFLALPPASWIDLPMFEELCYRGAALLKQASWHEAQLCYQSAERLYTGDLLADLPEKYAANRDLDWCWSRRYWYQQMYVKLLVGLAEIHRHTNHIPEALASCDKALQIDPICEPAHLQKMRLFAAVNRRDALTRQYRLYKNALKEFNMGIPSPEFEQIVAQLSGSHLENPP